MDSNGNQRKRVGRQPKNTNTMDKSVSHNEILENSAVAISPTLEETEIVITAPPSECRRSSRKKIIKFDVRDLLNKNRKTHKIQIEARIDSNAPSTSKSVAGDATAAVNFKSTPASREDLLSKHKTFLEKSAIFRRYSISQEQKPPPPLPIPPLLSKSNESKDSGFCGTSSSQEFLSNAMIKPKQPTSLIVAQIESNKPTSVNISKRKSLQKISDLKNIVSTSETSPVVKQKKRGRPAKAKNQSSESKTTSNITPEKAKNWKEYKACLAQQSGNNNDEANTCKIKELSVMPQRNQTEMLIKKPDSFNDSLQSDISRSDDDGSFAGFQINKDEVSCDSPIFEKKYLQKPNIAAKDINLKGNVESIEKAQTLQSSVNKRDEITNITILTPSESKQDEQVLEVSNIGTPNLSITNRLIFDTNKFTKPVQETDVNEDHHKEEVYTSITKNHEHNVMASSESDCGNIQNKKMPFETSTDSATHQITPEEGKISTVTSSTNIVSKCLPHTMLEDEKLCKEPEIRTPTTCTEVLPVAHINETIAAIEKTNTSEVSSKIEQSNKMQTEMEGCIIFPGTEQVSVPESITASYETKTFSRTSSSSESENASDRSIYSSDPFSTTSSSSTRSYRSSGMVKVAIKRISLPKSPSTSSQTSTSEELNNANIEKRKPPTAKRSKRLRKKCNDSLDADTASANIDDCSQRIRNDEDKLEIDDQTRTEFMPLSLCSQENQTETLTSCSNTDSIVAPSDAFSKVFVDSTFKYDEGNSMDSEIQSSKINESLNLHVLEKNVKRKSLRNRKDNNIYQEIDGKVADDSTSNETHKLLTTNRDNFEIPQEPAISYENKIVSEEDTESYQSDKREDKELENPTQSHTKEKENFGNSTPVTPAIDCTEDKCENLVIKEELQCYKQSEPNNSGEEENSMDLQTADFKVQTSSCLVNEAESCVEDLNIQQGIDYNIEKDTNQQKLSMKSSSEYQSSREENANLTSFVLDSRINADADKMEPSECKIFSHIKTESLQSAEETSCQFVEAPSSSEVELSKNNEEIFEVMQDNEKEKALGVSESPVQHVTKADKEGKINVDNLAQASALDVSLLDKNDAGIKDSSSSKSLNDQKKKLSSGITNILVEKTENNSTEILTSNTNTQKEIEQFEGRNKGTEHEMLNSESSKSDRAEIENEVIESKDLSGEIQNVKMDGKNVSSKESSQEELRIHQKIVLQNTANKETDGAGLSSKDKGTPKDVTSAKLLILSSEVVQNEIATKVLETEKDNETQFTESELETPTFMPTTTADSCNTESALKSKESHKPDLPSDGPFETKIVTSPTTKAVFLTHAESSKHSSDATLKEKLQEISSISDTHRESPLQDNMKQLGVVVTPAPKRRGRKPRFKNLHGTEDSETESSTGKITPIDDVMQPKQKALLQENDVANASLEKAEQIETKQKEESVNVAEESCVCPEDSSTNFSTSQIKNVSIETNTLLDILRTVQSNTAAALKANKPPIDINKIEIEEKSSNNSQDSIKIQQVATSSPLIFDAVSPSTAKKFIHSPERSNSNSPLTLKKVTPSPTRSSSASPLTLKKVTRRYERRSRRGEDSAHKTLEETFAEIAAQSSKAVLAAKEFEHKSPEELEISNMSVTAEKEEIKEDLESIESISATAEMNLLNVDRNSNAEKVLLNVSRDADKELNIMDEICDDLIENAVSAEAAKTTPTKRGRKPKNRASELPSATKEKEITSAREESEYKEIKLDVEEKLMQENYENKQDSTNVNQPLQNSLNEILTASKEEPFSVVKDSLKETELPAANLESSYDDAIENKPTKKVSNKHEPKETTEEEPDEKKEEKSDEARTSKLPIKKRDSSLNKNETKSVSNKKAPKKEDSLNLSKEDNSIKIASTTPPLSKRGRKPKNQQPDVPQTGCKKKSKKDVYTTNDGEDSSEEKTKLLENECETSLDNLLDEKLDKKNRQKKLKEAFEAALTDRKDESIESLLNDTLSPTKSLNFGEKMLHNTPPPERRDSLSKEDQSETLKPVCITPVHTEDPDPLKDIEKFIADGVNLLKKDYKLDENSVDEVIRPTPIKSAEIEEYSLKTPNDDDKLIFNTFETPADTPINTPSVTPPPKSPSSLELNTPDGSCGVRRSHRLKLITKTPKALVGRGLVRDRERFSIKDDVETKSHYTLDDHLTDLAEVEAKNAKFLKEMEERLSNFQVIKENEYLCERVISREARKMICDCFLTHDEEDRGELGCGEDCLNRLLMIECGTECNVKERCTNKRFQKWLCSPCRVFRTEKKGFGIMADIEILPGEFIMEYVGEVINTEEFEKRRVMYSQEKNRHYYFMALRSDAIIDATIKGNISRFINHSCDPNAETQKWTVNGELRIGFFSRKSIMPGEEITFNYQYQRYGREAQRCYCESSNCTGWIGQEPTSDEGEQIDDEDDETEDEEETVTTNLLVQDDEDDSDASVADPEEVQKRLEMAAAQAAVELAPLQLMQEKGKQVPPTSDEGKTLQDLNKSDNEEDSKSKFKKLLSKMAEKVAAKQKQSKREQKLQRKKKSKESSSELTNKLKFSEDPDIEDEVQFLKECGLKNQSDTLRLSRLMVRAKLVQTRLNLLEILRKGDLPCRRLFLDYHGLRLLHGWMSEDAGNMQIRLSLLQTLQTLPIANKTVLTDSKVMQVVRTWSGPNSNLSPNEDSSSSNSNSQDMPVQGSIAFEETSEIVELQKLALKLNTAWEGLPEIFRIPKKERIEQMKEHEREADRQYAANVEIQENTAATDRYRRDRFGRSLNTPNNSASTSNRFTKPNNGNPHKTASTTPENFKNLSKAERRELFAAKVARDEAEKRLAEERREFETKCRFFGLDPKKTRALDMPFCVNPATGQWFSIERKPITTPPSYAHVQVPVKPKSTDPNDYQLPAVCSTLPPQWKYAITPQGKLYFYHIKHRLPQWEPPSPAQLQQCELEGKEEETESDITSGAGEDSSDDDDDVLIGMDAAQLKAYINRKVESRRQKRYQRLVDERSISPRREEDRIYNQIEVRKYKENKEKIRKRKEDIRRKRAEALRQTSHNLCTLGSITEANPSATKSGAESDEELGALPIQDYLLSSDEEADIKAEVNSPLIDKIVEGDKIVDELDALTTKRQLKRPLPPHRDLNESTTLPSSSTAALIATAIAAKLDYKQEYKKRKLEKKEKRKPKEQDAKYRKNKEKFRCEIAGIIVHHLKPYLKETCTVGRIKSNEDFNHLARKLTHFVMIKELKYCESVGQTLVVTESVKSKSREFIKKYMAKYGDVYVKPTNDPDFKDIPFTL